jgi:hypothetical protein
MIELGAHVLRDLNVEGLADAFRPATAAGRSHLVKTLSEPTDDVKVLAQRQNEVRDLRRLLRDPAARAKLLAARTTLRETEADVVSIAEAAQDTRHAEYYNQILWGPKTFLGRLNEYGLVTEAMIFFRTLFVPGMSVLLPLFIFVAPLILYFFVLKKPIGFAEYFEMLNLALKKAMPNVLGRPKFTGRGGFLESGEQMVHVGVGAAVFIGSIWSQVSSALAMRSIVADMRKRAASLLRLRDALAEIDGLRQTEHARFAWGGGDMQIFGHAWNSPGHVQALLAETAEIDALLSVALTKRTCFVTYGDGITADSLWHPGVPAMERVYNSVSIGGGSRNHVLLTGPNRGGKSTLLKSLGAAVLMGQTLGVAFARRCQQPVFATITTALAPTDIIGEKSLFESEIEFAMRVRERADARAGPMFLMMDEIFHGTNAHDGVEAAQVFLDSLYARPATEDLFSVVSTHYIDLPARYGKDQTQNLCMEASADPTDPDRLIYTYRLCEGVNRFSSVREILQERGLLAKKTSGPAGKA